MLFPVKVVQKADDAPKALILRIELTREIAHGLLDRLAVLDMERILVVGLQQIESRLAGNSGIKGCHCMLLSSLEPCYHSGTAHGYAPETTEGPHPSPA